jgi:hypothetical protein
MRPRSHPKPKPQSHTVKIAERRDDEFVAAYGAMFVATCSCGWQSEPRSTKERAAREGSNHKADAS